MSGKSRQVSIWVIGILALAMLTGGAYWIRSRRAPTVSTIAFVPRAAGAMLWEVERFGATTAAEKLKCHIYWNAPTSEGDAAGQISILDKVVRSRYQGLVLAPNHALAILVPLRRALATGLPTVIVSAPLDIPANSKLGYIVNDDEKMGELAAAEVARLIQGRGSIALIGLTRFAPGVTSRVRGAERFLANQFPDIRVASRLAGAYDTSRAQDLTEAVVDSQPELKAILSFTATSTRGVHAALKSGSLQESIHIVGCEQDSDLIGYVGTGEIAALVAENTYRMGYEAVEHITASWTGKPIPARSVVPPVLITKHNFDSAEADLLTRFSR